MYLKYLSIIVFTIFHTNIQSMHQINTLTRDVQGQAALSTLLFFEHLGVDKKTSLSPDGTFLAWAHEDGNIMLTKVDDENYSQSLELHNDQPCLIVWSPDSTRLASATRNGTTCLWDVKTGMCLEVLHGGDSSDDVNEETNYYERIVAALPLPRTSLIVGLVAIGLQMLHLCAK